MGTEKIESISLIPPVKPIAPRTLSPTRTAPADDNVKPLTKRRRKNEIANRAGTLVIAMEINLEAGRIAFLSTEGAPVCGDVSTDLPEGSYSLIPDLTKKQWIFDPKQVKTGRRFKVSLEGVADPFDLVYVPSFYLSVTLGMASAGTNSLEEVKTQILAFVDKKQFDEAFILLDSLCAIDLYDLVNDIWFDSQWLIFTFLLNFEIIVKNQSIDSQRILCALESLAVDPQNLYIDSFKRFQIDPKSFSKDKEREKAGKSNIMIRFEYWLTPERAIVVYADDILDTEAKDGFNPQYREGCLLYPTFFTRGSTPRMWGAKKAAIAAIEAGNFEVVEEGVKASLHVINFVFLASNFLQSTISQGSAKQASARLISEAFSKQPGEWLHDFEGGTNMSEAAAAYEARVCNKDPGIGYYVDGVQFDGFIDNVLIDAKYYTENSGSTRALLRNNYFIGMRSLAQAERQVMAAAGRQVEWRVASQAARDKLQELFNRNKVPVKVTFVP